MVAVITLVATACDPGKVTPVAGTGASGNTGDGGPATAATFQSPGGIAAIPGGGYYVAEAAACVIRKVDAAGTITTVAGTGTCGNSGDGGPATAAEIHVSASLPHALDLAGNLYVPDAQTDTIRRIDTAGTITTVDISTALCLNVGFTVVPDGTIYVTCRTSVQQIATDGTVTTIYSGEIWGLTSDQSGILYISTLDPSTGSVVGTLTSDGTFTPIVNFSAVAAIECQIVANLAVDADGNLYGETQCYWSPLLGTPANPGSFLYRLGPGTAVKIAGNGQLDPATTAQTGYGRDLAITERGTRGHRLR